MTTVPIPDEQPLRCDDCNKWAEVAVKSAKSQRTSESVTDAEMFLCLACARQLIAKLGRTIHRNKAA